MSLAAAWSSVSPRQHSHPRPSGPGTQGTLLGSSGFRSKWPRRRTGPVCQTRTRGQPRRPGCPGKPLARAPGQPGPSASHRTAFRTWQDSSTMIRPVSRSRINASRSGGNATGSPVPSSLRSPLRPPLGDRPPAPPTSGRQSGMPGRRDEPTRPAVRRCPGIRQGGPLLGWLLVCPFMVKTVRPRPSSNLLPVSPALPPARKVGGCLGA
jgi:hypothetical protein